jgi:hypothetical protein
MPSRRQEVIRPDGSPMIDRGLCASCRHARVIRSDKGSTFCRCGLSDSDPHFPKYPRLPVRACSGYSLDQSGNNVVDRTDGP